MDKYITQSEGLLGVVQATMNEDEIKRSAEAGEKMWDAIKQLTDEYQLNVHEVLNATLGCHIAILEVVNEQIESVTDGGDEQ